MSAEVHSILFWLAPDGLEPEAISAARQRSYNSDFFNALQIAKIKTRIPKFILG